MPIVGNFFATFEKMVESTAKIAAAPYTTIFKKLIFSSILDTLSKTVTAEREKANNFERFSKFITKFCEWSLYSKVSVPHLVRFLKLVPNPEFEELRILALQTINSWRQGELITIDRDIDKKTVLNKWPKDPVLREPLGKISIDSLTHIALLWKYRNALVHEMKRLGFGIDSFGATEPCYHSMSHVDNKQEKYGTWELIYPVSFFETLARNGIRNLKIYYRRNELNPFDRYKFGSYWIEKLNE